MNIKSIIKKLLYFLFFQDLQILYFINCLQEIVVFILILDWQYKYSVSNYGSYLIQLQSIISKHIKFECHSSNSL